MNTHESRLTDAVVSALKPAAKEYEVHDTLRDGLRLRVNPGGTKSWTLFYHRWSSRRGHPTRRVRDAAALDEDTMAHIFEPFFTTKEEGRDPLTRSVRTVSAPSNCAAAESGSLPRAEDGVMSTKHTPRDG
jgi:hypothetical protein